jgi:hypothetical protein
MILLIGFRRLVTDLFGLRSTAFGVESTLSGSSGGDSLAPGFGRQGRCANQMDQSLQGVLTILFLGSKSPGLDDQYPRIRHPFPRYASQAPPDIVGQRRGPGSIKPKLNSRSDLIDVLPARARGPNKRLLNLPLVNGDIFCYSNHSNRTGLEIQELGV